MSDKFEEVVEEIIDKGYTYINEDDSLITITEEGLKKAMIEALRAAYAKGLEDAAREADKYAVAAGDYGMQVSKKKNSECISAAIRRLLTKEVSNE